MEKRKRHYDLNRVKTLIHANQWKSTYTAGENAYKDFGLGDEDIKNIILRLTSKDYYKSMTSYHDAKIWQDVYCPLVTGIQAYIKLQIVGNDIVIIQFKKK